MGDPPKKLSDYRELSYWNSRYERESDKSGSYEWFMPYESDSGTCVKSILRKYLNGRENENILVLGCGNSSLGYDMYKDGFTSIFNIDYSPIVISAMSTKYSEYSEFLHWSTGDFRDMKECYEDNFFSFVIDKATLDAVWSEKGDLWNPSDSIKSDVSQAAQEIIRVLRPGGQFLSISFGQPHFRLPLLNKHNEWVCTESSPIEDSFYHFYRFTVK